MVDAEGLVTCLLQRVLPLIMNHADAETILEDPKVHFSFTSLRYDRLASCVTILLSF